MPVVLEVEHTTTYQYANPVTFGEHRAMFLPRGSYGGRILHYSITSNIASTVHWTSDTRSNNVAVMAFSEPAAELTVTARFRTMHHGFKSLEHFPLARRAETLPVQYTSEEWVDLVVYLHPYSDDSDGRVAAWAKSFILGDRYETADLLQRMMDTIRDHFEYQARYTEGTQSPGETLEKRTGTCRDYAWLMIEALRRLGIASRFVTGYLYDSALDGGEVGMTGSGATHAWLEVYLPGAGWLNYDPTNRITEGHDLIHVAIARHPEQAVPLAGSWYGSAGDYQGMTVNVVVRKLATIPDMQ